MPVLVHDNHFGAEFLLEFLAMRKRDVIVVVRVYGDEFSAVRLYFRPFVRLLREEILYFQDIGVHCQPCDEDSAAYPLALFQAFQQAKQECQPIHPFSGIPDWASAALLPGIPALPIPLSAKASSPRQGSRPSRVSRTPAFS